eukprot:4268621-Alexandrium_andersonii.AAC.1
MVSLSALHRMLLRTLLAARSYHSDCCGPTRVQHDDLRIILSRQTRMPAKGIGAHSAATESRHCCRFTLPYH